MHSTKCSHSTRSGSSVGDPRREDVAAARDVLAVAARVLVEALVVDGQLALELHVVEGRHPPRADDREAPLLVRIEPRQMQVRGQPGREAQEAEDHVLDAVADVGLAVGGPPRSAPRPPGTARPRRRAPRGSRARSRRRAACRGSAGCRRCSRSSPSSPESVSSLSFRDARVVLEQVADHQHPAGRLGRGHGPLGVGDRLRQRLLDEAVLAGLEHADRELGVGRDRGGQRDRVERRVRRAARRARR